MGVRGEVTLTPPETPFHADSIHRDTGIVIIPDHRRMLILECLILDW